MRRRRSGRLKLVNSRRSVANMKGKRRYIICIHYCLFDICILCVVCARRCIVRCLVLLIHHQCVLHVYCTSVLNVSICVYAYSKQCGLIITILIYVYIHIHIHISQETKRKLKEAAGSSKSSNNNKDGGNKDNDDDLDGLMPYKKKPRHSSSTSTSTTTTPNKTGRFAAGRSPTGGESGGQSRKRMNMDKKYGSGIKQKMKGKMTDKK